MTATPVHEMITPVVSVPTISVRTFTDENPRTTVCIQWFGESESPLPEDAQFLFEPLTKPDSPSWNGEPEAFKVIFIGPIRDFPKRESIQQIADMVSEGDVDSHIVWMVSSKFPVRHPTAFYAPTSFMVPLVILGDPVVGLITPKSYYGAEVLAAENAAARAGMTLAEKLLEDPSMGLPPDEMLWRDEWDKCDICEPLARSYDRAPAVPLGGTCTDRVHLCPFCGRRWWQFNRHFHLWKHVTSKKEWDAVRREAILEESGLLAE